VPKRIFTAIATCAVFATVGAAPSSAIVGGSDAAPGEFPSVAEIQFGASGIAYFGCTGTLIDSTHVLSAGHCASITKAALVSSPAAWPPEAITVWIGSNKAGEGEQATVSSVTIPPEYLGLTDRNDLSILELAEPSANAPTQVAAGSERSIWDPGTLATIAGWGVTEEDGEAPDTLQKAQVPITTDEYCESAYSDDDGWDFDPETMVCAGYPEGGTDTCQGDSGGPLFADASGVRRVVGVTSWGNGCAQPGQPGVYARVADTKLRTWVESVAPDGVADDGSTATGTTTTKAKKQRRAKKQRHQRKTRRAATFGRR
jgi:secreted trypsin-like serine protease